VDQTSQTLWKDGTPVSARFDDPYFSLADGVAETGHVFLAGNDLPRRLRPGFVVAELGFGTGLNLLALAGAVPSGCPVRFVSFEAFPMAPEDATRALAATGAFPDEHIAVVADILGRRRAHAQIGTVVAEVHWGDARDVLPSWSGRADAWFLDGFSPAKNPQLWEPALMAEVARHTAPSGTFATYTAAGHVRRALAQAGFAVERVPGYGRKRHMTRGVLA